jgi:hypothetical protein
MNLVAMEDHILRLSDFYGLDIVWIKNVRKCMADYACDTIHITPIDDVETYVSALHEIGHFAGRYQNLAKIMRHIRTGASNLSTPSEVLMAEYGAWEWAKQNALLWTDEADAVVYSCLSEYYASYGNHPDEKLVNGFYRLLDTRKLL